MSRSKEKAIRQTRFAIDDLQKRVSVLEATREDLERQIRKLTDSVPENQVDLKAQKDGYVSYGSYAQSVIARKENIRATIENITSQQIDLAGNLKGALDALDGFERLKARHLASKAEKTMRKRA